MDSIARLAKTFKDPRYYQIAVLSSLVIFGVVGLDFGIRWIDALLIVTTALAMQYLGTKITGLPRFDPLSPLITSLSLTLLFRTDLAALAVARPVGLSNMVQIVIFADPGQGGLGPLQPDQGAGLPQVPVVQQKGLPKVESNGRDFRQMSNSLIAPAIE